MNNPHDTLKPGSQELWPTYDKHTLSAVLYFFLTHWSKHGPTIDAKGTRDTEGLDAAAMDMDLSRIEL